MKTHITKPDIILEGLACHDVENFKLSLLALEWFWVHYKKLPKDDKKRYQKANGQKIENLGQNLVQFSKLPLKTINAGDEMFPSGAAALAYLAMSHIAWTPKRKLLAELIERGADPKLSQYAPLRWATDMYTFAEIIKSPCMPSRENNMKDWIQALETAKAGVQKIANEKYDAGDYDLNRNNLQTHINGILLGVKKERC